MRRALSPLHLLRRRVEQARVWLLVRLLWRDERRLGAALRRFQAIEADSAWQLATVLPKVSAPKERAEVFEHILEEMNHAELFRERARELAARRGELATTPQAERTPLYAGDEPAWKFFAYCIVGEQAALDRFGDIAKALPDGALRDTFRRILRDEAGHVHNATELANDFAGDAVRIDDVRRELGVVRRRRFRETWVREGRRVTDVASTVLLSLLYLVLAPLGAAAARRRIYGNPVRRTTDERLDARHQLRIS